MITPLTFCSTQTKVSPKKTKNKSAQLCTSATAVVGGAMGGYGIKKYMNLKNDVEQKIESEKLKIKCKMLDEESRIYDDCITNSDYIRELTTPPCDIFEMWSRGLEVEKILTESEKESYQRSVECLSDEAKPIINHAEAQRDKLVDYYIRQSDFAKQHPHETPYTIKEIGDLNLTMKDILSKEKYEEYLKLHKIEEQKINMLKSDFKSRKSELALDSIQNSDYFKNMKKTYSLNDLKEMGKKLNDILSFSERQALSDKLSMHENKFKEIEEQAIQKIKAELNASKKNNLYIMGGAGIGIFLLSVLSLLSITKKSN